MTEPVPWPRAAAQVKKPALQTCEQRPVGIQHHLWLVMRIQDERDMHLHSHASQKKNTLKARHLGRVDACICILPG